MKDKARKVLRAYCNWLIAHQGSDGMFARRVWYKISYPLRTLTAGYQLFGEETYLNAVMKSLDKLLSEQLPNGAWTTDSICKPVSACSSEELDKTMKGSMNMADIGSIAVCLVTAFPYIDVERKERYLAAAKRYADRWASRWILPSGAFSNAICGGRTCTTPYSVAIGTEGMLFAALYGATGEQRYLDVASRAVEFQLDHWLEDGRPIFFTWDRNESWPEDVTDYGNIYYLVEGIIWVYHYSDDVELRDKIKKVLSWYIRGEKGLLKTAWWDVWFDVAPVASKTGMFMKQIPSDLVGISLGPYWSVPKSGALLTILMKYDREIEQCPEVQKVIEKGIRFLCRPHWAERIGVMINPRFSWGRYAIQATGFAGLSLAEYVRPGIIFKVK